MVLIPPPHQPTPPLQPLRSSAKFIDWSCENLFLNCRLPPPYLLLYFPWYCFLQDLLYGAALPSLHPNLLCCLTCYLPINAVMEPLQHLHYQLYDEPDLTPIHQDFLRNFLIEHFPGLHLCPCLHQNPDTTTQFLPQIST